MKRAIGSQIEGGTPTIVFFGLFGGTNLGNEATLAAMIANIRKRLPDVRMLCVSPRGSPVKELHGMELIEMDPLPVSSYLWRVKPPLIRNVFYRILLLLTEPVRQRRARKTLLGADLFVIPGTGIADDYGQGPLDLPLHLYRWCQAARRCMPVCIVSVGAGPATHAISKMLIRSAFGAASLCSLRDTQSCDFTKRLGIDTEGSPVPDLAFSLPSGSLPSFGPTIWPPKEIGIGVMGYHGWNVGDVEGDKIYRLYLSKIKALITSLLERGKTVRLLIGDTRSDGESCRELVEWRDSLRNRGHANRIRYEPIQTVSDLLRELGSTDAVIATRFHNVLLALLAGRPTISLSYDEKNDYVMRSMNFGEYCFNIETFDPQVVIQKFSDLESKTDPEMPVASKRIEQFRLELDQQYENILRTLKGPRP